MCVVSNVGDHYNQKWQPIVNPGGAGQAQNQWPQGGGLAGLTLSSISREEFDALKRDVLEMKQLLIKAKEIDEKTGQKDCEMEEKIKVLRQVADLVGVNLNDIFPKKD